MRQGMSVIDYYSYMVVYYVMDSDSYSSFDMALVLQAVDFALSLLLLLLLIFFF